MTTQTKKKKAVYISINLDEFAALEKLGFRERWAYLALKRIANFKTGIVGQFGKQKLGYTDIASLIKPPPGIQGRGEGKIDDTQARDFILRMEAVGLVRGIGRRPNGGLRFTLPMSPINRPKAGDKADIFPEGAAQEFVAEAALAEHPEVSSPSQSLLNYQKSNINTEEAAVPSSDGAASDRAFGATPCRTEGAAPLRENPPAVAGNPATLTPQQIYDTLAESYVITETNTPQAWQLYEAWAGAIRLDDLHAAIISVEEREGGRETTPSDLMPYLFPVIADCRHGQSSA
jgi:hypothetical protein